ncbi:MAG: tRNA 5-hydroxyuridine modification protein YegQ [Ectothiorhodospiraceae bacterium]|nr:tRNA 5-hydroxyuridine modification protein YegQ [Ectothiorhodospiraceae bacterium]
MKRPELLSPAGTLKNMRYALAYGADAVYAGQPRYSLRARNNDFDLANLKIGIDEAHAMGKKLFVASNISPHNAKIATYMKDMAPVIDMKPDALIMADPGLIMMVRERWPEMPIHLSVQANTVNYATVKFWGSLGIERVILSRELSLDEIAEIRQQCPDMELEVFVHGALCIAYSGRCLLSGYFNHRDPNQGTCTNSCRWDYKVSDAKEDAIGNLEIATPLKATPSTSKAACGGAERHPEADKPVLIEEPGRTGEQMVMEEDEHGTYIMNSKDLRAVEHVKQLVDMGIDCLKIEGRTKSHYYAARTAQVYRQAIDEAAEGKAFDPQMLGVLEGLANRGYTDGFYERHTPQDTQNYLAGHSRSSEQQFVGEITRIDQERGLAEVVVKNKFAVGDRLQLIHPSGNRDIILSEMSNLKDQPMDVAPGGGHTVLIPWETNEANTDANLGLLARYLG